MMKEAIYLVGGMTCSACSNTIIKQVSKLNGVENCEVSLVTDECHVKFDGDVVSGDEIGECIEDCGFDCEFVRSADVWEEGGQSSMFQGVLTVQGMTCSACSSTIMKQVGKLGGVANVEVSLVTEECHVQFDQELTTIEDIRECIEDCGFDSSIVSTTPIQQDSSLVEHRRTIGLKLVGLDYTSDTVLLKDNYNNPKIDGQILDINLTNSTVTIQYDPAIIGIRKIVSSLEDLGYSVLLNNNLNNDDQLKLLAKIKEIRFWQKNFIVSLSLSIIVTAMYMLVPMLFPTVIEKQIFPYSMVPFVQGLFYRDIIGFILASFVQFTIGIYFYRATWSAYKHGSGTMDTLICLSTTLAYLFSIYSIVRNISQSDTNQMLPNVLFGTSVMLITFISFGKLLENKAKSRTSTALSKLISLAPSTCEIMENSDGEEVFTEIPTDFLEIGDTVVVKAGMKIPVDGVITKGSTEIDESFMTGESLLVTKKVGSEVISGTINGSGQFYFQTTGVGEDTKLSQIIKTMKDAQLSKAPIQRYSDYLASIFVPVILILALLTFIFWLLICLTTNHIPNAIGMNAHGIFFTCLQIAISVVVVACPCALGLAAPTAIMVGTGTAAENGILIKGGEKIEMYDLVEIFLFDKTGTLTTGQMEVKRLVSLSDSTIDDRLISMAMVASETSDHPVSKAISKYCKEVQQNNMNESEMALVVDSNIIIGQGLSCQVKYKGQKHEVLIGNKHMMPGDFTPPPYRSDNNCSISYLAIDGVAVAKFEVSDTIREDSYETIQYLKDQGYQCYMVTGDLSTSALQVAEQVGIDYNNVYSEVTPQGKCDVLEEIQLKSKKKVAFVGDGINDSPALVKSDIGISISTGTDIAMEAADVIILADNQHSKSVMKKVAYSIDVSKKTFQRIKLNLFWALFYNTFMVPIAMGILIPWGITLHPMSAAFAMAMSSVSVVLSSLALKRWKPFDLNFYRLPDDNSTVRKWLRAFKLGSSVPSAEDMELQENLV